MMSQRVTYSALFLKEVRITFQTYDCCVESFVVKQGALFYEKARNIPLSCLSNPYRMKKNK